MMNTTKAQAKDRIMRVLDKIRELTCLSSDAEEFIIWKRGTQYAISSVFGQDSRHLREFKRISFTQRFFAQNFSTDINFFQSGLGQAKTILESMLDEIEGLWPDDSLPRPISDSPAVSEQSVSNKVFVVHGRDIGTKDTVARFLESLGLEAVILQEQANEGRTIVEKFEDYSDVGFAVVLCTPDDVGSLGSEPEKLRPRPRQNVVLEWGFFFGKLGRNRVCALVKGDVEIPSDYAGVLYVPLDESGGWKWQLATELQRAGLAVDLSDLSKTR